MSDIAVVADPTLNPAQSGPAIPNSERPAAAPAADAVQTPEQIAAAKVAAAKAAADAGKTPEQLAAEAALAVAAPVEAVELDGDDEGEEAQLPTSADADADGVVHYQPTGSTGMDMALAFVGKLGIGMDHPAMQATLDNDFTQIRAFLATLGDKAAGYNEMVNLAEAENTRFVEQANKDAAAINTAVANVLGDAQAEILKWASTTATPAEKKSINAMLRADPVQARAGANILKEAYQAAGGTVVTPASAVRDPSTVNPNQQSLGRISNAQFANEAGKLSRQFGPNYMNTPEYAALSARRA